MNEQERADLEEKAWLHALNHVVHVADPEQGWRAWCGDDGVVTTSSVVSCVDCIGMLQERVQYYNQLRPRGLRTVTEAQHEQDGSDG